MRQLAMDETVGTILIDVDSPGGTVAGIPEAAQEVFNARATKRIVAIANSKMASAAYWIASQAHELVAIPSAFEGVIGSIGVFTAHRNLAAALEKEGVSITMISAGPHKLDGNPLGPLSDERRAELQAMVDATYARFVKDVARGRGVKAADVKAGFGQGRGLSAVDALAAGMIDRIATMEETIARLSGGARASSGRMAAEASSGVAELEATKPAKSDMVDPDEDGECPDGYEMGDDGMCHLMPMEEEAKKAAARTDAEQIQAASDQDANRVAVDRDYPMISEGRR
jgi:signal peptide peptidase SppA